MKNVVELREAAIAAVLAMSFLYVFFQAVRTEWPGSYFGPSDVTSYAVTASPLRYAGYRLLPLFTVCLFVAVTLERRDGYAIQTCLGIALTHAALTNGRALGRWARSGPLVRHRVPIALVRAVVFVGLVVVGYVAFLARGVLSSVVPPLDQLTSALWTAILAGVLGVYITNQSRHGGGDQFELVDRSAAQLDGGLKDLMVKVASANDADPNLGLAVMAVENLQRPPWFRQLERVKSLFVPSGTYGVMQVSADSWISDEESVRRAVETYLKGIHVPDDYEGQDNLLRGFAESYNPDPIYFELLQAAYFSVTNPEQP